MIQRSTLEMRDFQILGVLILILIVEYYFVFEIPAFWDATSKFKRASWLFENNFSQLVVPTDINSGHPPLWIWLLGLSWKIFGKSLWAARLLLLMVNIGVVYQVLRFLKTIKLEQLPAVMLLLVFIEPTFMAQSTILNNDMLLLFFTFLGLNSLLRGEKWLYGLALIGLLMTNLRGIYCVLSLFITHLLFIKYHIIEIKRKLWRCYIVAISIFSIFLMYQYQLLDWIIITKHPTFSTHREPASFMRSLKNTAAFVKNYLDYGRVFYWIPVFVFLVISLFKKVEISNSLKQVLIPIVAFTVVFFAGMVPFSNPMGPRYFIICYLLGIILSIQIIDISNINRFKKRFLITLIGFALLSGHFWIYPATISQGWDSSLAYVRYFSLEEEMLDYIESEGIETASVGTYLGLNNRNATYGLDSKNSYDNFARPDMLNNEYYLFSNIENDTEDDIIRSLEKDWILVKELSEMGVFLKLYKR